MALSLRSGFAGAATVTALHQLVKYTNPKAPRMDTLGRRALSRTLRAADLKPPKGRNLQYAALLADLVANSLFFGLVGSKRPLVRGAALGTAAGYGAVSLPPKLLLGWFQTRRTRQTKRMSFLLYLIGGLAAGWYARRHATAAV